MTRGGLNVPMLALFLVLFVVSVGFGLVIPLLPLIAREYEASAFMIGTMTAGYSIVQFIFSPIWGQISDRVGRKPVLMVGIAGLSLSFLVMGFADSFWGLFTGRVLGGFLGSATLPAAQAMAAELSSAKSRAGAMGLMGAAFGTGFIVGPLFGGVLAPYGFSVPFFASAGLGFATVALAFAVLREVDASKLAIARANSARRSVFSGMAAALSGPAAPFYLLPFAIMMAQSSLMTALALFLTDRFHVDASLVGLVFAFNGACGAFIQGIAIGPITRRFGEYKAIFAGLTVGIAGFLLLISVPTFALVVPSVALTAVSMSLTRPSSSSLLSQLTTLPQGITMGLQSSFDALGRVVGPLWAGFAYDHMGTLPFLSAAAVYVAFILYLSRHLRAGKSAGRHALGQPEAVPAQENR